MRVKDVDEALLVEAVVGSASWAQVKRRIGVSQGGAVHAALRRRVAAMGLSVEHLQRPSRKYNDAMLAELVARSRCMADVLRALGLSQAGGTHAHLSRRVRALGCDTSHFSPIPLVKPVARPRLTANDILVRRPDAERRRSAAQLIRALCAIGRAYVCTGCGTGPVWQGRRLVLSVDHIDGDWRNDEADNLRFLCPNCHSQTPTFCRKIAAR